MKSKLHLILASLLLASTVVLRAELSAQGWLETYYLNPQPAELPAAIRRLSHEGYFQKAENTAVAIGFISTVFAQNPDRVEGWLKQLSNLPDRERRLLAAALWQSGHAAGNDTLRALAKESPVRAEVERLATLPSQRIAETPVQSASSMNLQWGAFLASGDQRHVVAILDAFGLNQPQLNSAARLALAQHAAAHPRVLDICRAQLDRQPEDVRSELRAALRDAAAANPRS